MTTIRALPAGVVAIIVAIAACTSGSSNGATTNLPPPSTTLTTQPGPTTVPEFTPSTSAGTLRVVQDRGLLRCGVNESNAPGFTDVVDEEVLGGFDVDFCRAVAAAVLGDADRVKFVLLSATDRFNALASGDIDVLFRNTTWTSERDTRFDFGPTIFHDGQQLMAPVASGFNSSSGIADLLGATVCVNAGTTTESHIREAVAELGVELTIRPTNSVQDAVDQLIEGSCTAITADGSALAGYKRTREPEANAWVVFPQRPISKEPLGPVYRSNDSQWADIVNWTVFAMIIADEKGITSSNVRDLLDEGLPDREAALLLGVEGSFATDLGVAADAFLKVIEQVGNYDEIFSRNLNPLGIIREASLNASAENFGLIQAPPVK